MTFLLLVLMLRLVDALRCVIEQPKSISTHLTIFERITKKVLPFLTETALFAQLYENDS